MRLGHRMEPEDLELLDCARRARERAYAPVSSYRVGAALRCPDGVIVEGCNVEHVVLGETVCAEKVAIVKAVSDGRTRFDAVAVCTDDTPPATPCGSCRQMLHAWGVQRVVVGNLRGEVAVFELSYLLPNAFTLLP